MKKCIPCSGKNKTVSLLPTIYNVNEHAFAKKRTKVNGNFRALYAKQSNLVKNYNHLCDSMGR